MATDRPGDPSWIARPLDEHPRLDDVEIDGSEIAAMLADWNRADAALRPVAARDGSPSRSRVPHRRADGSAPATGVRRERPTSEDDWVVVWGHEAGPVEPSRAAVARLQASRPVEPVAVAPGTPGAQVVRLGRAGLAVGITVTVLGSATMAAAATGVPGASGLLSASPFGPALTSVVGERTIVPPTTAAGRSGAPRDVVAPTSKGTSPAGSASSGSASSGSASSGWADRSVAVPSTGGDPVGESVTRPFAATSAQGPSRYVARAGHAADATTAPPVDGATSRDAATTARTGTAATGSTTRAGRATTGPERATSPSSESSSGATGSTSAPTPAATSPSTAGPGDTPSSATSTPVASRPTATVTVTVTATAAPSPRTSAAPRRQPRSLSAQVPDAAPAASAPSPVGSPSAAPRPATAPAPPTGAFTEDIAPAAPATPEGFPSGH